MTATFTKPFSALNYGAPHASCRVLHPASSRSGQDEEIAGALLLTSGLAVTQAYFSAWCHIVTTVIAAVSKARYPWNRVAINDQYRSCLAKCKMFFPYLRLKLFSTHCRRGMEPFFLPIGNSRWYLVPETNSTCLGQWLSHNGRVHA